LCNLRQRKQSLPGEEKKRFRAPLCGSKVCYDQLISGAGEKDSCCPHRPKCVLLPWFSLRKLIGQRMKILKFARRRLGTPWDVDFTDFGMIIRVVAKPTDTFLRSIG